MPANVNDDLVEWVRSHYFGKYRGTVSDNADPTSRGRLKVQVPAILDANEVWAMPCVPYAGDGVGFYALPEPGTGVWVEFEGGDPSFPIWTGCFWADNQLPDGGGADVKIWKTGQHTVRLDDKATELKVATSKNASVTLTDSITTEAKAGTTKATHTVSTGGGVVSEATPTKVEVTAASFSVNSGALEVV
jgi:uncharacterized protein involved in type VI secretion and phage assembly